MGYERLKDRLSGAGDYLRGEGRRRLGIAQQDSIYRYDPLRIHGVKRVRKFP